MNDNNMTSKNLVRRIGENLYDELQEIQEERVENGTDKKKVSLGKLSNMIPFHDKWPKIKEDLINFKFNKKGISTIDIFTFILMGMMTIIVLGIMLLIFNYTDQAFDLNVAVGQVNLSDVNNVTFGRMNDAFNQTADLMGIFILFGEIITMFATAYYFRGRNPKVMIVIDIFILIFALILSVYVANTYETLINSAPELDVFLNQLEDSSSFILKLPLYVGVIGIIIMLFSYAFPRNQGEENILGF